MAKVLRARPSPRQSLTTIIEESGEESSPSPLPDDPLETPLPPARLGERSGHAAHYHRVRLLAEALQLWIVRSEERQERRRRRLRLADYIRRRCLRTALSAWVLWYAAALDERNWVYGTQRRWFRRWALYVSQSQRIASEQRHAAEGPEASGADLSAEGPPSLHSERGSDERWRQLPLPPGDGGGGGGQLPLQPPSRTPSPPLADVLALERRVGELITDTEQKVERLDEIIRSRSPSPQATDIADPSEQATTAMGSDDAGTRHDLEATIMPQEAQAAPAKSALEERLHALEQEVHRLSSSPAAHAANGNASPAGMGDKPGRSVLAQVLAQSPPEVRPQEPSTDPFACRQREKQEQTWKADATRLDLLTIRCCRQALGRSALSTTAANTLPADAPPRRPPPPIKRQETLDHTLVPPKHAQWNEAAQPRNVRTPPVPAAAQPAGRAQPFADAVFDTWVSPPSGSGGTGSTTTEMSAERREGRARRKAQRLKAQEEQARKEQARKEQAWSRSDSSAKAAAQERHRRQKEYAASLRARRQEAQAQAKPRRKQRESSGQTTTRSRHSPRAAEAAAAAVAGGRGGFGPGASPPLRFNQPYSPASPQSTIP